MKYYYQKKKIKKPENGRRFAVGDIHGCYKTFKNLVENRIELTHDDQLFLLGDYISKGPKSKKTLNYIMKLISMGYQVYPLRGNHEQDVLEVTEKNTRVLKWLLRKSPDLIKDGSLSKQHFLFLESLPYYYKLPDFYLVHAGFNFKARKPLKDKNAMLWRRMPEKTSPLKDQRIIIHGHQSFIIDNIKKMVNERNSIIGLDNGVNYIKKHKIYDYTKMGNLCALNLDTFELIVQKNIETIIVKKIRKHRNIA
ncbi:MAG: metallophosphoesterase [Bacteroidales bacterium]